MIRLVLIFTVTLFALVSCQQKDEKPNIILIYVDDMGLGDASFTSGKVRSTPNIDKMAAEGKVFTQYYTNAPVCSPSRVAVTTGMYPLRWSINTFLSSKQHNRLCDQADYLQSQAPTLAKTLKAAGYITAHIGKWHMGGGRDVEEAPSIGEYGFDEFISTWESPSPDPLLTSSNWIWAPTDSIKRWERTSFFVDKTLDFLDRNKDHPCFVNFWPDDVHSPWVPDEESQKVWKKTAFTLPKLKPVISDFDKEMGHLMKGLENLGIAENTLIVFTSDNGPAPTFEYERTIGLRGCKNSLYEGGINMPFFVLWPTKIRAGQVDTESIISAVDLFPTLCEIGGAKMPNDVSFDGDDLSKLFLSSDKLDAERKIFWEYGRRNPKYSFPDPEDKSPVLAVRYKEWKCFTSFDGTELELYNLKKDPSERNNVAHENIELAELLKKAMLEWFVENDKSEIKEAI